MDLLSGLEGIEAIRLDAEDVVRHRLVREIILAYERSDEEAKQKQGQQNGQPKGSGEEEE